MRIYYQLKNLFVIALGKPIRELPLRDHKSEHVCFW